ncbi:RimK family alpha-L-glutamate ligase [Nocardia sp. NPDC052566]|uniref:RimK family alpha-L-glutamate ligase n=1 Tax=Nocardia sp. NPDC052566 TaxID=3364330 RepID=UPI0037C7D1D4
MRVGLLTADPGHPLLAATAALLSARGHEVRALAPTARHLPLDPADIYLLKARTPAAIALARALEQRGVRVINSAAATEFCQDRVAMAHLAHLAGLPFAATTSLANPRQLTAPIERPLVLKSRHSRRGDLVAAVSDADELDALARRWPDEPVIVQDLVPGTNWDHKLWVVAGEVFAALRRSEFAPGPGLPDRPSITPHPWAELALRVGEVFGLDVYGVDLLEVDGEPLIVDINAFPGIRGQAGAPEALSALVVACSQDSHGWFWHGSRSEAVYWSSADRQHHAGSRRSGRAHSPHR